LFFFFFQAEDGIRDFHVTGVQTCALPIFLSLEVVLVGRLTMEEKEAPVILQPAFRNGPSTLHRALGNRPGPRLIGRRNLERPGRSEERRVGKECRTRWSSRSRENRRATQR